MAKAGEAAETTTEEFTCPKCGRNDFKSLQGMRMHQTMAHKDAPTDVAVLWQRLADATDILFPEGVPSIRVIEIGKWQEATLKMLSRK